MKHPTPPGDSDWSAQKYLWLQGKMEQINQGAAAKPPVAGHRGGFQECISVSQETTSYPQFQQPEWPEDSQPLSQKLAWKKWVKETVLKGTASMKKPQDKWAF